MELRLKAGYEEMSIYIPQQHQNVVGKFIDSRLYPHLYKLYPDLFEEIVEIKKTKKVNDILINDNTNESNTSI
ncbi:hypothetical protein UFOVP630_10 [uncultured Caudovirales phage]|uniref:Uncharacterized protein n=1 Tax=uncultured Caudovirales phage TaxID=2100421 RepID=A0A6J5N6P9_9CAUD|nr:hypothetical protein UFOVP630_10 [uncultured Caudovirales phage]